MTKVEIFDTHAHYDDEKFNDVRDELIPRLFKECNVGKIVNVGVSRKTNTESVKLAEKYDNVYAACGYHPHELSDLKEDVAVDELKKLLSHPKCVAVGEIGLDYHYDAEFEELQKKWFRIQMSIAGEMNMPVIIHDREAHGPCFDIVSEFPNVKGVFHSYSGSAEMAHQLINMGWYISFSGVVTFKNARKTAEVAAMVPNDRLLVETDCPYLAPEPVRGSVNNSSNIIFTVQKIAELRNVDVETILKQSYENAMRFYSLTDDV